MGEACQKFSEIWRKPRGLFLSYPNKDRIEQILCHARYDGIRCIVVSDGERILGLGDQGAGGMGIPIGKMALYTALGGIRPEWCLPILLDVGTDNEQRLADPLYIGWRNKRVRGTEYEDFVDHFVSAVKRRWPHVLLAMGGFRGRQRSQISCALSQRTLHLQRRHTGHGRGCDGHVALCRQCHGFAADRTANRRRWFRRGRDRNIPAYGLSHVRRGTGEKEALRDSTRWVATD